MEEGTEEPHAIAKFGYWTLFDHCQEGDHGCPLWSPCLAGIGLLQGQHIEVIYAIDAATRYDYALLEDPDPRRPYCRAVCGLVHGIGESQCVYTCTRREHFGDPEAHEYRCDDYNEPDLDLSSVVQTAHEDTYFHDYMQCKTETNGTGHIRFAEASESAEGPCSTIYHIPMQRKGASLYQGMDLLHEYHRDMGGVVA